MIWLIIIFCALLLFTPTGQQMVAMQQHYDDALKAHAKYKKARQNGDIAGAAKAYEEFNRCHDKFMEVRKWKKTNLS